MEFYRVRPKEKPDCMGAVARVERSSIEAYAGSLDKKMNLTFSPSGELTCAQEYFLTLIDEKEAEELKKDEGGWKANQALVGSCSATPSALEGAAFYRGHY